MKTHLSVTFVLLSTVLSLPVLSSTEKNTQSMSSCASLLPKDQSFTLEFATQIDTSNGKIRFHDGALSLSDATKEENPELKKAIKPFIDCIKPLIK